MAKTLTRKPTQLSLEFAPRSKGDLGTTIEKRTSRVASFVDAKTLKVRREAKARVASAGIFSVSKQRVR